MLAVLPANVPTTMPAFLTGPAEPYVAIGAVVVGAVLLLWGRVASRVLVILLAGAVGYQLASAYAPQINLRPLLGGLGGAVIGAALGLILARLAWAIALGLVLAAVGAAVAMTQPALSAAATQAAQTAATRAAEGTEFAEVLRRLLDLNRQSGGLTALPVAGIVGGLFGLVVGLVVGLVLPRVTVIFMSSLLGATLLTAGGLRAAALLQPDLEARLQSQPTVLGGIAATAFLIGLLYQALSLFRKRRGGAVEDDEDDEDDD